ncbi:MAG TPA: MG2 domain-containing protein [Verrucomicrobiae bacterium]|nr:MG2 domain-containing protein [Verrucomicrobiae bacterium]
MKPRVFLAWLCLVVFQIHTALAADYESAKAEAEKLFADGSFAKAHKLYESIAITNLPAAEQRWIEFRRADAQWRSQAATQSADSTQFDEARHQLEVLIRDVSREEDRDRVWAEVQESLGDFFWTRRDQHSWNEAWPHYQSALDWWAGAADVELARQRYLAMIWRTAKPPGSQPYYYSFGSWGNYLPIEILDNTLKIAQTENDKAHAHYLMAMTLRNQGGDWNKIARVPAEFEGAIQGGKSTDWYDDALYNYAEWMMGRGDVIPLLEGGWKQEANYPKALELFRKLVREFNKGETQYYDRALQQIHFITDPQLTVSVPNIFLPDSEIQYHLNWRNVKRIELSLYPVELNRDVKLAAGKDRSDWLQSIDLSALKKTRSWSYDPHPASGHPLPSDGRGAGGEGSASADEDYKPGSDTPHLDERLKPGAYVIEAEAGGKRSRDLILVTDASIVLKSSGDQALVYFCDALDGSPIGNAEVRLWEQWREEDRWNVREHEGRTGEDGIAVFELENKNDRYNWQLFASAIRKDRQAFAIGNSFWYRRKSAPWKIYAFTDRPAYRPGETVNWKFIARQYDGANYSTPANQKIEFEINDPRGAKLKSDTVTLNSFGSAWGSLEVTEQMPLGEYQVQFWDEGRHRLIGVAALFRIEEYKLPEFKVTVQTPEEATTNGAPAKKKTFRLGETVEATIQADYYFGGAVANASVEVVVHQSPYWHDWHEPHPFPWFYENMDSGFGMSRRWRGYGGDQIVKRETLKTDATGKATISFETPANNGQDLEYRIEARVTDSSRREIIGNGTVRVTKQRYYVNAKPEHCIYRPQDKVQIDFKALDANDQPVQTEGTVKVTRDFWFEIWIAPDGKEVKGEELKRRRAQSKIWPPAPERPDQKGWRLKFRGYEHDDILTRTLKTDTNGATQLSFTPEREGYYRIAWTSEDVVTNSKFQIPSSITTETTVWVANNSTTELGYRHDGVEIIADKDTFRVGQIAPVMLVANTADRYVLFSVEGEDLYSYQLVHLNGTVKLIQLPIEEKHVPNIFLNATLVSDRQIFTDSEQVIVPPTKNFLTVDVKSDRPQYQPRDEGTLTVTTRNDEGEPVSAEVALSLVDESVFYIQSDFAGDPRQFFFGTKRNQMVQSQSTFQQKSYAKLVEVQDELMDERDKEARWQAKEETWITNSAPAFDGISITRTATFGESINSPSSRSRRQEAGIAPSSPPMRMALEKSKFDPSTGVAGLSIAAEPEESTVVVRSDFRSTVFWQPDVITGKDGKATVKVKYPDSTTSWKATARAVTAANQFGIAETNTQTRQPLIVRLQAPRFFVVGDTVTISAVINNNTDTNFLAAPFLDLEGLTLVSGPGGRNPDVSYYAPFFTNVLAKGEVLVDWQVRVEKPGTVKIKAGARERSSGTNGFSDAMERTFIAYEHGIEKFISKSGKARGDDITVKLDLPAERKTNSTSLTVQITPSLAVTMLDALPYLIDYPYGCTEQTMSRFLPAAITAKTLRDLGLKPEDIMGRVFGGIETNFVSKTQPKGKKDLAELEQITKAGLDRLYDFQHGDGGWGWWKEGESDHWMTAYVVWGLTLAQQADVDVRNSTMQSAVSHLEKELVEEEANPDMQAFMLHALGAYRNSQKETKLTEFEEKAFTNLWNNREKLNAYTRSLLALSAHNFGKTQEAKTLIANLENGVKRDERPDESVLIKSSPSAINSQPSTVQGTAHWGEDGVYWRWSDGGVEATAFALRALLTIDPTNQLVEPVCNWLIKNRRGAQWNNTRDTAIVVLAMNDYLSASGELKTDIEYELIVNGSSIAKKKITGADVFNAPSRFEIDPKLIRDQNEIQIKRSSGTGALYFAAEAKFFSTEEPIAPAGNEIFVKREYYKLVGRPTLLKGYVYDKQPLRDGETVKSGERVQTVLTIEAKNNYEYLMFEDLKPAGLEAVEIRSGESLYAKELKSGAVAKSAASSQSSAAKATHHAPRTTDQSDYTGRERWVYQELRDRKVALFIDKLPQGVWEIRYDVRAEVPGKFHALPVIGQAMYVPEIRCNGAETRITVEDIAR